MLTIRNGITYIHQSDNIACAKLFQNVLNVLYRLMSFLRNKCFAQKIDVEFVLNSKILIVMIIQAIFELRKVWNLLKFKIAKQLCWGLILFRKSVKRMRWFLWIWRWRWWLHSWVDWENRLNHLYKILLHHLINWLLMLQNFFHHFIVLLYLCNRSLWFFLLCWFDRKSRQNNIFEWKWCQQWVCFVLTSNAEHCQ